MSLPDRFKDAIAAVVDQLIPNRKFFAPVEYRIVTAGGGKFSALPARRSSGYPAVTEAPIRGIAAGNAASTLSPGTSVLVGFIEGDRSQPFLLDVLESPLVLDLRAGSMVGGEHLMTVEACCLLIYNTVASFFLSAGPGPLSISPTTQALIGPALLTAIAAQGAPAPPTAPAQVIVANALLPGFLTGVAPVNTSIYFKPAIDLALATPPGKTANDSGLFPSIGCKAIRGG